MYGSIPMEQSLQPESSLRGPGEHSGAKRASIVSVEPSQQQRWMWPSRRCEAATLVALGVSLAVSATLPFSGKLPVRPFVRPPLANTLVAPHVMHEYEKKRNVECQFGVAERADAATAAFSGPACHPPSCRNISMMAVIRPAGRIITPSLSIRRCALSDGRTFITRLGMVHLAPGEALHWNFGWPFGNAEAQAAVEARGYVGSVLSAVDEYGRPWGSPPLRIQYASTSWRAAASRVAPALRTFSPYAAHVSEPHGAATIMAVSTLPGGLGDRECRADEGGVRCQFLALPLGTRLRRDPTAVAEMSGVMVNEGDVALRNLSLEMAVIHAPRAANGTAHAGVSSGGMPAPSLGNSGARPRPSASTVSASPASASALPLLRDVVPLSFALASSSASSSSSSSPSVGVSVGSWPPVFRTFESPAGLSLHYSSWTMPLAGRVEASDFHTHGDARLLEAWIVSASAVTLGLRAAGFEAKAAHKAMPASSLRLPPSAFADGDQGSGRRAADQTPTLEAVQRYVRESLQERRVPATPAHPLERERVLCVFEPDAEMGADRIARVIGREECASWRFRAGEPLTLLAFLDAQRPSHMHVSWRPLVSFDDESVLGGAEARGAAATGTGTATAGRGKGGPA